VEEDRGAKERPRSETIKAMKPYQANVFDRLVFMVTERDHRPAATKCKAVFTAFLGFQGMHYASIRRESGRMAVWSRLVTPARSEIGPLNIPHQCPRIKIINLVLNFVFALFGREAVTTDFTDGTDVRF